MLPAPMGVHPADLPGQQSPRRGAGHRAENTGELAPCSERGQLWAVPGRQEVPRLAVRVAVCPFSVLPFTVLVPALLPPSLGHVPRSQSCCLGRRRSRPAGTRAVQPAGAERRPTEVPRESGGWRPPGPAGRPLAAAEADGSPPTARFTSRVRLPEPLALFLRPSLSCLRPLAATPCQRLELPASAGGPNGPR